jgi:hypothetical protein
MMSAKLTTDCVCEEEQDMNAKGWDVGCCEVIYYTEPQQAVRVK